LALQFISGHFGHVGLTPHGEGVEWKEVPGDKVGFAKEAAPVSLVPRN
jgi:hypothetical protein